MGTQKEEALDGESQGQYGPLWSEREIAKMSEVSHFNASTLADLKILHSGSSNEAQLKVFRDLRSQAFLRNPQKNFVCLVTSVCAKAGVSYVARNLAAAIAWDPAKTSVLVDCNVRAPSADALLNAGVHLGLSDYLAVQEMGIESILYASGIKRLRVVPMGNHINESMEEFSSFKMGSFLAELKARYSDRYVVLDAPSLADYPAQLRHLSAMCDFVVVVVPQAKVSEAQLRHAVDTIGEERVAGCVLNRI